MENTEKNKESKEIAEFSFEVEDYDIFSFLEEDAKETNNYFNFIFKNTNYLVPTYIADIISPIIQVEHMSDPIFSEFYIPIEDKINSINVIINHKKGIIEPIDDVKTLLFVCKKVGCGDMIVEFLPPLNQENIEKRLQLKCNYGIDNQAELRFKIDNKISYLEHPFPCDFTSLYQFEYNSNSTLFRTFLFQAYNDECINCISVSQQDPSCSAADIFMDNKRIWSSGPIEQDNLEVTISFDKGKEMEKLAFIPTGIAIFGSQGKENPSEFQVYGRMDPDKDWAYLDTISTTLLDECEKVIIPLNTISAYKSFLFVFSKYNTSGGNIISLNGIDLYGELLKDTTL